MYRSDPVLPPGGSARHYQDWFTYLLRSVSRPLQRSSDKSRSFLNCTYPGDCLVAAVVGVTLNRDRASERPMQGSSEVDGRRVRVFLCVYLRVRTI